MTLDEKIEASKQVLAKNITRLRNDRRYDVDFLSEKTKLNAEDIKKIEEARHNPSLKELTLISSALEVSIHILLSSDSDKS